MKPVKIIIYLLLITSSIFAQNSKVVGKYRNFSGKSITLNSDSTFNFKYHFSILGNYVNGIWTICNDTIYLKPIFKELRPKTLNGEYLNLSVSPDKKKIIYTKKAITYPDESDYNLPLKLFFKKNKLFDIDKDNKIIKGYFTENNHKKKYPLGYEKILTQ